MDSSNYVVNKKDTVVYAAKLKDKERLKNSSSGGAFSAISSVFIESGNAVVSAIYNYERQKTEFKLYTDTVTRDKAIGSKYMQSFPGEIYREALDWLNGHKDKELLFIGMGCQAAGFRRFAEMNGVLERITVVDIICHGSPSPLIWEEYSGKIESTKGKITYLTFKDKKNGWKGPKAYVIASGRKVPIDDYVKVFYSRCALRPACHRCPYTCIERNTDITIGDYWGIEDVMPDFYDEKGVSLLLIHTDKGMKIFDKTKAMMDYRKSNVANCIQPNLQSPTEVSEDRDSFWLDYNENGINFIMKKYGDVSFKSKLRKKARIFLGGGIKH